MPGTLYYGDNLDILRRYIADESIDLIYLDPPFNSNATYNILFAERNGTQAAAQAKAFEDTWKWGPEAQAALEEVVEVSDQTSLAMQAFHTLLGHNNMLAYLAMMAPRLKELRRVLKATGGIFLHCDPTASHYLKLLMDAVFGPQVFQNEIIWRRTGANSALKRFGPIHQTIFYYTKSVNALFYAPKGPYTKGYVDDYFQHEDGRGRYRTQSLTGPGVRTGDSGKPWRAYDPTIKGRHWQPASYLYRKYNQLTGKNLADRPLIARLDGLDEVGLIHWSGTEEPTYKQYLEDSPGVPYQDIWAYQPGTKGCVYGQPDDCIDQDVKWLDASKEKLEYPTQKPEGLLSRIIRASSHEGDVVLDPFCGCGTTVAVAERLQRQWIGIDITYAAIAVMKKRLNDAYGEEVGYDIVGEPKSLPDAAQLAKDSPYQFQWWALDFVGARPVEEKKGADKGIDGRLFFYDDDSRKAKQIIFSVKSGGVTVAHVRDLRGAMERDKAEMACLISLEKSTRPMRTEALDAGSYKSPWGTSHPGIQLLTIAELLEGKRLDPTLFD
jgi:site-specific DNA-methyltransferase (adenine-specific)